VKKAIIIILLLTFFCWANSSGIYPVFGYSDPQGTLAGLYYQHFSPENNYLFQLIGAKFGEGDQIWLNMEKLSIGGASFLEAKIVANNGYVTWYGNGNENHSADGRVYWVSALSSRVVIRKYKDKDHSSALSIMHVKLDEISPLNENVSLYEDQYYSGIALNVRADTRDLPINSTTGNYWDLEFAYLPKNACSIEGVTDLVRWTSDMRWFQNKDNKVTAARFYCGQVMGESYSYLQAMTLGGEYLRGFAPDRFVGRSVTSLQLENRFPINKTIGGELFIEAGQVGEKIAFDDLHYSNGYGVYFLLPNGNARLRIEKAVGDDGLEFLYISYNHAF